MSRVDKKIIKKINSYGITEYYNLISSKDNKLSITLDQIDDIPYNDIVVDIRYNKYSDYNILNLPKHLNNVINQYLEQVIILKLKITYPGEIWYAPVFYLIDVDTNHKVEIDLIEYYSYLVKNHNLLYKKQWNPCISIDKNLLDFVRKINHFDYILC
jgi:hypothetical protein